MTTIFVHLPYVDDEWAEASEQAYYEAGWNDFRHTAPSNYGDEYAEGYERLTAHQHRMWEPHYCTRVYNAIPDIVRNVMEDNGVFDVQITSDNVDAFNQASRDVCASVADVIADTYHELMGIERA